MEQAKDPLNEFEENDNLLYSTFPQLFPLGSGLRRSGTVPEKDIQHLLQQWSGHFANCTIFLFFLFDQFQRHSAARQVHAYVYSNQTSMESFSKLISHPTFLKQLEDARKNPDTPEAKQLVSKITTHISVISRKVSYTNAARSSSMANLLNMVRYYGLPTIFFTLFQDDTHGMLNLRMTLLNLRMTNEGQLIIPRHRKWLWCGATKSTKQVPRHSYYKISIKNITC